MKAGKNRLIVLVVFFDAAREQDFTNILNIVLSHVVDNTTAQVNFIR